MNHVSALVAASLLVLGAGCSKSSDTACAAPRQTTPPLAVWPDDPTVLQPAPPPPADFQTARHEPFPTIPARGPAQGIVQLEIITAGDEPLRGPIEAFGHAIATSHWWREVGADYGLPPAMDAVLLTHGGPIGGDVHDADIQTYVRDVTTRRDADDQNVLTIRVLFLPDDVHVITGEGANCGCAVFGGYHSVSQYGHVYAVVQHCPAADDAQLDDLTKTASHEIIEAATDDGPTAGYRFTFDQDAPWTAPPLAVAFGGEGEGEVADLCNVKAYDGDWTLTRVWSNTRAAAGEAPCVPAVSSEPYFDVTTPQGWYPMAAGESITIPLTAWSSAPRPDWYVLADAASGTERTGFEATIDGGRTERVGTHTYHAVNNGDAATLKVTAPAADANAHGPRYAVIRLSNRSVSPSTSHAWYVGVYLR